MLDYDDIEFWTTLIQITKPMRVPQPVLLKTRRTLMDYRLSWNASSNISFRGRTDWQEWDGDETTEEAVYEVLERGSDIPEGLSDGSLGFGGMAGQMITTAQTIIVLGETRAFVYFGGRFGYAETQAAGVNYVRALHAPTVIEHRRGLANV
jgi:hypothetical protein